MAEKTYNVGIYCRLSNDDERDGESVSIENQKLLLQRYVQERGWNEYGTYIDDGFSGTNFQRPGVQRLIADAKAGKINVILVKDLSRFGRNYIEFGQYTDYLFPSIGCRFIALNNGIDTMSNDGSTDVMCFLNLFNEFYSRDTSKKVKAVKKACAEDGKFLGMRRSTKNEHPSTPRLFFGKLICADCKHTLTVNRDVQHRKNGDIKEYVFYQCSLYNRSGYGICSAHRIYEKMLSGIVLTEIKAHAQAVAMDEAAAIERLKRQIKQQDEKRLTKVRKEVHCLQHQVQELEGLIAKLYEDKYSGAISESTFIMLAQKNEQERLSKTERLDVLQSELKSAEKEITGIHNWVAVIRKYRDLEELDRTVIDELIERIEIGERSILDGQRKQDIKVVYRFVGVVEGITSE